MSHSRGPQSSPLARESHVLLEEHWAQPHHHWLLAERSTNWKKTALKYPLLNPTPHPGPWVCSHHGNFWKHQSYFPGGGEGWKQGIVMKSCLPLPSQLCWFMSFHTDISWGDQLGEGGISSPCRQELGQGEGGVAEAGFRGKAVSGERVALIQNDPFKGPREAALGSQGLSRPRHTPCV